MSSPQQLINRRLLLRAHQDGEPCAPRRTIDAEEDDRFLQRREDGWHYWVVQDGRFQHVMSCDRFNVVRSSCPTATLLGNGTQALLPTSAPLTARRPLR